ncbi:MAG TPA: GNAT family protein [Anaerolineae bacterium]|nr:GNAT family protein [Anaerolineae bacterium]
MLTEQLFEGQRLRLAPADAERDAEIISKWSHDLEYLRLLSADIARPLSPFQVKKQYAEWEKDAEKHPAFNFAVRLKADDRLLGFARLYRIEWTHGTAALQIGLGDRNDRGQGYGREALGLVLRYAFNELNLYRLAAATVEYNEGAIRFFERAGFVVEVRWRQAVQREGRRWDAIMLGLLRDEWKDLGK